MEPFVTLPQDHILATTDMICHSTTTKTGKAFFDRLPAELLIEIFVHANCLDSEISPTKDDAPILLCRICKRWRRIAMDTPILWTEFSVCPSPDSTSSDYMEMMRLFLNLSRHYPLTFENITRTSDELKDVTDSFPLFLSEIDHWYDVYIGLDPELYLQLLAAPIGNNPLLEVLSLSTQDESYLEATQLPSVISKFTRLRKLYVDDSVLLELQGMPWAQLTILHIEAIQTINECVYILNECSSLVKCHLNVYEPEYPEPFIPHDIILPSLELLHLVLAGSDVNVILSCLTCPTLVDLYIHYGATLDRSTVMNFLSRSSCTLRGFRLTDSGATEDDIISYITTPALQSVVLLSLEGFGPSLRTLDILKHKDNSTTFMPFLEMLVLDVEGVPDNLVSDMIASRFEIAAGSTSAQRTVSRLNWVRVTFRRPGCEQSVEDKNAILAEHRSDLSKFKGFRKNGLKITMHTGYLLPGELAWRYLPGRSKF